jgi:hypothetical protein
MKGCFLSNPQGRGAAMTIRHGYTLFTRLQIRDVRARLSLFLRTGKTH